MALAAAPCWLNKARLRDHNPAARLPVATARRPIFRPEMIMHTNARST